MSDHDYEKKKLERKKAENKIIEEENDPKTMERYHTQDVVSPATENHAHNIKKAALGPNTRR